MGADGGVDLDVTAEDIELALSSAGGVAGEQQQQQQQGRAGLAVRKGARDDDGADTDEELEEGLSLRGSGAPRGAVAAASAPARSPVARSEPKP